MNAYEKIIKIIRKEAKKAIGSSKELNRIRSGIMKTPVKCELSDSIELDDEDMFRLVVPPEEETYESGDEVVLYKVSDEQYVILGKKVRL